MSTPEQLGAAQVRHIAALARLELSDQEASEIQRDLEGILEYVAKLTDVDVTGVEPLASPHGHCSRLHQDQPEPPLPGAAVLQMAPAREGDYISVPKVLGGGPEDG
ncbi:MAG: Asp-tRNA(Asn)/Glu-tRNA(Gln) amidotransferase subunit GatC [Phycisphaerales bacterium]|jgi:aspartyl-tRNA(Asn)/glutamyl-tRNA(Gln) amidotransferase subunit C|nr:Asp-tRNA(Asn)/Glu-tRNA(Gln) amidotransferase subunit GatC [Phycisphaerales bacterium]